MRRRAPPADAVEPPAEETLATESVILRALLATGPLPDDGAGEVATGVSPVDGAGVLPLGSVTVPASPTALPVRRTFEEVRRLRLRAAPVPVLGREPERAAGTSATLSGPAAVREWPIFTLDCGAGRTGVSLSCTTLSESSPPSICSTGAGRSTTPTTALPRRRIASTRPRPRAAERLKVARGEVDTCPASAAVGRTFSDLRSKSGRLRARFTRGRTHACR
jgi:hypothetical protein